MAEQGKHLDRRYTKRLVRYTADSAAAPLVFRKPRIYIQTTESEKAEAARNKIRKKAATFQQPAQYIHAVERVYPELLSKLMDARPCTRTEGKGLIRALYYSLRITQTLDIQKTLLQE